MSIILDFTVKKLTGHSARIQISQSATVIDLKKLISTKLPDVPFYRTKLMAGNISLDDDCKQLSLYKSVVTGMTMFVLIENAFKIYVQDPETKIFEIEIPATNPMMYTMAELRGLVQTKCGHSLNNYQFQFNGKPLQESNHGRKVTLQDHNIKKEDTVFLMKLGLDLDIVQPMIDICFMMDCTSSMSSWIVNVKSNITKICDRLVTQYKGCDLQLSFVRYTDYDLPEDTRTTYLNFTKSISAFHSFVNPITAQGGGDGPEDIMGGLKVSLSKLNWRSSSAKVLIHIADAPCHGTKYHAGGDTYPNGDPAGITHEQMMQEVSRLGIQYWFGYIRQNSTDKMIDIFNDSLKQLSSQRLIIRQFDAEQAQQIADAVHKSVTASVTANEAKKASLQVLGSSEVNWGSLPVKQAVKTTAVGSKTLQELQGGLRFGTPSISFQLKIASSAFNDGEESVVYKGLDTGRNSQLTLKNLKAANNKFDKYSKVQEMQAIANAYAQLFNRTKPSETPTIEFIAADIVDISGTYYVMQEFVGGKFEKYNTNNGIVCSDPAHSDLMQAFSHFTYVKSEESILICDLEGVVSGNKVLLTDPAIHNRLLPGKYGPTDSGYLGMKRFFLSHECKSICRSMRLDSVRVA